MMESVKSRETNVPSDIECEIAESVVLGEPIEKMMAIHGFDIVYCECMTDHVVIPTRGIFAGAYLPYIGIVSTEVGYVLGPHVAFRPVKRGRDLRIEVRVSFPEVEQSWIAGNKVFFASLGRLLRLWTGPHNVFSCQSYRRSCEMTTLPHRLSNEFTISIPISSFLLASEALLSLDITYLGHQVDVSGLQAAGS
jgi:hypothetical protein